MENTIASNITHLFDANVFLNWLRNKLKKIMLNDIIQMLNTDIEKNVQNAGLLN